MLDFAVNEGSGSRAGDVAARHGAHVELGEPVWVGGSLPWACPAKLVGREKRLPRIDFDDDTEDRAPDEAQPESEPTHTLLLRTGRGRTPEEARQNAASELQRPLAQPPQIVPRATQSPPPPLRIIMDGDEVSRPSEPPIEVVAGEARRARRGWLGRLLRMLGRG